jgi:hypothetical protein
MRAIHDPGKVSVAKNSAKAPAPRQVEVELPRRR